jgi:hypothetical protein
MDKASARIFSYMIAFEQRYRELIPTAEALKRMRTEDAID